MLEIKNLYLKFTREYFALFDINIQIEKGESVALIGEDESGKTSLLRVIAKLEKPSQGEVYIREIPLKKLSYKTDISAGYIPDTPVFFEKKTVYQNFVYIHKTQGYKSADIDKKINEVFEEFSIEKLRDTKIKDLSLEEKYMLSLVRLSFRQLDLLMIDNIFEHINQETQEAFVELVKRIKKKDTTLIVATTKLDIAKKLCKRNIYFKNGSIVDKLEV